MVYLDTLELDEKRFRASFRYNGSGSGSFYLSNKKSYLDFNFTLEIQFLDRNGNDLGPVVTTESKLLKAGNKKRYTFEVCFDKTIAKAIGGLEATVNTVKNYR